MNSLEFYISLMSGKINVKQRCIEYKQAIYFRHFVKGIKNAIFKLSKRKDCQILLRWQKSVTNTVWYALAKYKGKFGYRKYCSTELIKLFEILVLDQHYLFSSLQGIPKKRSKLLLPFFTMFPTAMCFPVSLCSASVITVQLSKKKNG